MLESYPRTTLFGTEERTLFCSTLVREYHLEVRATPPDSAANRFLDALTQQ